MSVTISTEAHDAATAAITGLIGTGGKLKLRLAGTLASPGAVAATLLLSATAFGAPSSGVATANGITADTNAAGNASAVATASLEKSTDTIVIHFEIAASGADADLTNGMVINAGDSVSCSALTFRAIAG